ncbi:MAG: glycosyltransferase [Enterocloster sp.]
MLQTKNHTFLLDIFQLIHARIPHSKLLLVGNGPLMERIQEKAEAQGLTDSIIFYGVTDQVASLMQAMDILVLPSLFEGLGIVSIEAQASGLKVISSKEVPKASSIIDELTTFLPLSAPAQTWSDAIINEVSDPHRYVTTHRISAAGYDISTSVHDLEAYYEQALHRYCS